VFSLHSGITETMRPLFALLVFVTLPLRAWDSGGHEIIAAIAYAHLNPKARAAVDQLATQLPRPAHPYDFITLSCWMDDIRHDATLADYGRFKSWHYIDIPVDDRDPMPDFVPGTDNDVHGNAIQGLKRALVVLDGGTDPYVRDQAMALALIEHLVGDIHQPLHCATKYFFSHGELRDDKGGNDEFVLNGPSGDTKFNLHAFWDAAWRATFDESTGNIIIDEITHDGVRDLATQIDAGPVPPFTSDAGFDRVARESNKLAREVVYPGITATDSAKNCRLSSAYVAQSREHARQQLLIAGRRLAGLLNATLGADTAPPVPKAWPAGPAQ
jgi:S1/P1 Nuclease